MLRFITLLLLPALLSACAQAPKEDTSSSDHNFHYGDIQNAQLQVRITSAKDDLLLDADNDAFDLVKGIRKRWPDVSLVRQDEMLEPDAILIVVIESYAVDYKTRPDVLVVPDPEQGIRRAEFTLYETVTRLTANAILLEFHSGRTLWTRQMRIKVEDDNKLDTGCFDANCVHTGIRRTQTVDLIKNPDQNPEDKRFVAPKSFNEMMVELGREIGKDWPEADCQEDGLGNCFIDSWRKAFN